MSKIGKNAFVVMAMCEKTKMPFGITVDPRQGKYVFTWSFKLKLEQAKHEGYDKTSVNGEVVYDNDYRGCPYCGSKSFYLCGKCGKIVCYHGQENVTCPNCGSSGWVQSATRFDLSGGGM